MTDSLTLIINGQSLTGWTAVRVTRGIERCPNDFELDMSARAPDGARVQTVKPGDADACCTRTYDSRDGARQMRRSGGLRSALARRADQRGVGARDCAKTCAALRDHGAGKQRCGAGDSAVQSDAWRKRV